MPRPLVQLLIVNVFLATLFAIVILHSPPLPAVIGSVGGGFFVYLRHRSDRFPS